MDLGLVGEKRRGLFLAKARRVVFFNDDLEQRQRLVGIAFESLPEPFQAGVGTVAKLLDGDRINAGTAVVVAHPLPSGDEFSLREH